MSQAAKLSPSEPNLLLCSKGGMPDIHRLCAQTVKVHDMTLDSSALGACDRQVFDAQHHDLHP